MAPNSRGNPDDQYGRGTVGNSIERQTVGSDDAAVDDQRKGIFFAAVQTTRMPMIITDPHQPDNPIIFANEAFLSLSGYSFEDVVGRNCRFLQGPDSDRAVIGQIAKAIREETDISVELINYRKDGTSFWNALYISPVYDEKGNLWYFFASQLDVSRRHDAEDALRQSQKMESFGQLTGGIAHDFNNLLQVVIGYASRISTRLPANADPMIVRGIDQIIAAGDRGAKLTQQLLAFARKQRLETRAINLNTLVGNMIEIAGHTLGVQTTLRTQLADDLWITKVDPSQVEVALLNLLINARDAMPDGGEARISTRNVTIDGHSRPDDIRPGQYVEISVNDTGHGIDPAHLPHVMEPFFTTKPPGKGTGLGLSQIYGFMAQSEGHLRIKSVLDQGTSVIMLFPATGESDNPMARQDQASPGSPAARKIIMAVEDDPLVADLTQITLEEYGYQVVLAPNADEALRMLLSGTAIDLLFTDVIMPGSINGVMLAHEVRRRWPSLPIIITTGYTDPGDQAGAALREFAGLHKPYRASDLGRIVAETFEAAGVMAEAYG